MLILKNIFTFFRYIKYLRLLQKNAEIKFNGFYLQF
jgi:hypothetical protein